LQVEKAVIDPVIGYNIEGNPILAGVAKVEYVSIMHESNEVNSLSISELRKEVASW
jgi:hypothetical protein